MNRSRSLAAVSLAIVLALTSLTMAVARGQMHMQTAGGLTLVICAGAGPVTVTLDADGNPVGPVHVCPDCALALIAAVLPPDSGAVAPSHQSRLTWPVAATGSDSLDQITARARGPPRLI